MDYIQAPNSRGDGLLMIYNNFDVSTSSSSSSSYHYSYFFHPSSPFFLFPLITTQHSQSHPPFLHDDTYPNSTSELFVSIKAVLAHNSKRLCFRFFLFIANLSILTKAIRKFAWELKKTILLHTLYKHNRKVHMYLRKFLWK